MAHDQAPTHLAGPRAKVTIVFKSGVPPPDPPVVFAALLGRHELFASPLSP